MKCRSIFCTFALLLCLESVSGGSFASEVALVTQKCCTKGTLYAREHSAKDCKLAVADKVSPKFILMCRTAMTECCDLYYDQKKECDAGIGVARKERSCNEAEDNFEKSCCQQCMKGMEIGEQDGICHRGIGNDNNEDLLLDDAFKMCCGNASKVVPRERKIEKKESNISKSPLPLSRTYSMCDEFGPTELCAHHCIAVPGSYRCECNPGYRLMSDKRNCIETYVRSRNRCKVHNPCQHKCNDIGLDIKCSCRKGYQLMRDAKSCIDIDECRDPHICPVGTKCRNYDGTYKCIPAKMTIEPSKGECPPGYTKNLNNDACDDIDECQLLRPPCPKYLCENTIGGYKCDGVSGDPRNLDVKHLPGLEKEDQCPKGYKTGDTEECEDLDECLTHQDNCNRLSQFCINTRGSFHCQDRGSKHCPAGFKINPHTHICEDIDECSADDVSICPVGKVCVNVPGAYDCIHKAQGVITHKDVKQDEALERSYDCPIGTRKKHGSSICEDINECVEGTHLCDQHQNCINTNGSHECECKAGFELDNVVGACVDVNECSTDQNNCIPESQRCDNTIGSYLCIRVMPCGTGYILQYSSGLCEDIDECALGTHNCANQSTPYNCINIPGSFTCVKPPPDPSEYEYYDYDYESSEENTTTTTTNPLSPTYTKYAPLDIASNPNYTIHNIKKDDFNKYDPKVNEIEDSNNKQGVQSPPHVVLVSPANNTAKIKGVKSDDGAVVINTKDVPENEWTLVDGKPKTTCKVGYESNSYGICVDIDECATNRHLCKPIVETCRNNIGGYICECSPGFRRDYITRICNKIPPTTAVPTVLNTVPTILSPVATAPTVLSTKPTSPTVITSVPTAPTVISSSVPTSPTVISVDISVPTVHSSLPTFPTISTSVATSSVPTSTESTAPTTAVSAATYTTATVTLSSSKTSSTSIGTTSPSITSGISKTNFANKETHKPFRSRNNCDAGYHLNYDTQLCEDINECTNGQAKCADVEICVNTEGGFKCECPENWVLDSVRHRCVPSVDKNLFPSGYGNIPGYNRAGQSGTNHSSDTPYVHTRLSDLAHRTSTLKCKEGYEAWPDFTCQDINECEQNPEICGEQICYNLPGGYICKCPSGLKPIGTAGDRTCVDVDECELAGDDPICSQNAECINTIGSYKCECHHGFRNALVNDKVCMDVNECTEAKPGTLCQHRCDNTWGGYRCSCLRGYKLNADNKTCSDINECELFKDRHLCLGKCVNVLGSYDCSCPHGYRLADDNRNCIDIDECETGEAHCAADVTGYGVRDFCLNVRGSYKCQRIRCPAGYKLENKHRCTKTHQSCPVGDHNCTSQPVTISFNYITFVSHLDVHNETNLYTMKGPSWANSNQIFRYKVVHVDAPPGVKRRADEKSFVFRTAEKQAAVLIVESLEGPQTIELEVTMEVFYKGSQTSGKAIAKLFIYVSEYDF